MNRVFDGILRTGHFPEASKRGKIIMIQKAGEDPRKLENIRPITLLSHMAKTFERALLTNCASSRPRDRSNTGSAVVIPQRYMEKAFDRMWHDGLVQKLLDTSLLPAFTRVVASFLQRPNFDVGIDDVLSAPRLIRAEVPRSTYYSRDRQIP
ncbi:RNA-directed DNA polymerase from mobile element jockey [Eumeta japonica]|uniref:RNA-directed DNA polymerase from mobile element jockey n=1 Tax=Eumeta variegata TaxID=151549 RepID=A0A4C1X3D5_EUMVA|nr:RNA-directed DNA polymerase from mobile element jockey [Eumeta japonica]